MKQLNLYYVAGGGHTVPNGSTVLPTDDVQILLNCADIWNKSYTTLSELLADSTTLQAVINSTNAIDYLVRSTSFAKSEALVPVMTSNTTPSGVCSGNGIYGSTYDYFYAFDGNGSTRWASNGQANKYISYDFGSVKKVKKVDITPSISTIDNKSTIKDISIKYSNDGATWNIAKNATLEDSASKKSVILTTPITARYWSVEVANVYTTSDQVISIYTLQFYSEDGFCDNATAMSYIGLNNYASNTLLADSTWCSAICNSTYFESVLNVKVPTMTSNTTPSGEVSSQSHYSGREPYLAFDGNSSTRWNGSTIVSAGQSISEWIKYKFTQRVSIKRLSYNYNSANTTLIIIEGSNDNSTFREVARCSNVSQGGYTYAFTNPDDYQYYRLTQTQTNNTTGSAALPTAVEIQLYGRADILLLLLNSRVSLV